MHLIPCSYINLFTKHCTEHLPPSLISLNYQMAFEKGLLFRRCMGAHAGGKFCLSKQLRCIPYPLTLFLKSPEGLFAKLNRF